MASSEEAPLELKRPDKSIKFVYHDFKGEYMGQYIGEADEEYEEHQWNVQYTVNGITLKYGIPYTSTSTNTLNHLKKMMKPQSRIHFQKNQPKKRNQASVSDLELYNNIYINDNARLVGYCSVHFDSKFGCKKTFSHDKK